MEELERLKAELDKLEVQKRELMAELKWYLYWIFIESNMKVDVYNNWYWDNSDGLRSIESKKVPVPDKSYKLYHIVIIFHIGEDCTHRIRNWWHRFYFIEWTNRRKSFLAVLPHLHDVLPIFFRIFGFIILAN